MSRYTTDKIFYNVSIEKKISILMIFSDKIIFKSNLQLASHQFLQRLNLIAQNLIKVIFRLKKSVQVIFEDKHLLTIHLKKII